MDIPEQWWTLFRSPELDRLVREALANSPTLAQATARLKQAQAQRNIRPSTPPFPRSASRWTLQHLESLSPARLHLDY